jgi:hypothetical protein
VLVVIVVAAQSDARATSCSSPPEALEAAEAAEAVFVGEIETGGNQHHPLWCVEGWLRAQMGLDYSSLPCVNGYVTFCVRESFKGYLGSEVTLVVDSPLVFRDRFSVGTRVLVYASRDERGDLSLNICGRNMFLSDADGDLKLLRAKYPSAR